ncbi:MAG: hypothetical protein ACYCYP_04025 [Leptospirales bacterium]
MRTDRMHLKFVLPILLGTVLQLFASYLLVTGEPKTPVLVSLILGFVLWVAGSLSRSAPEVWFLMAIPVLFPVIGPVLLCLGMMGYFFYGQTGELLQLADFSEYKDHLVLPGEHLSHQATLERIRKLQPAGDILKGQDIPLKQSVLATISQEPSENAVRLLQGAKNDPDDEVRMIASTLLTRVEKAYMDSITRAEKDQNPVGHDLTAGNAYLRYADSGLPALGLRDRAIRQSLVHFQRAILSGAVLEPDLLDRLFMEAVRHKDRALENLIRIEIGKRGEEGRTTLEFIELFEQREFRKLSGTLSENTPGQVGEWFKRLKEWNQA